MRLLRVILRKVLSGVLEYLSTKLTASTYRKSFIKITTARLMIFVWLLLFKSLLNLFHLNCQTKLTLNLFRCKSL
jgi:hypothetical protein